MKELDNDNKLTSPKISDLENQWESLNSPPYVFPENGEQARSVMVCFTDLQGLSNIVGRGELDSTRVKKYEISRRLALHYEMDISDLPEKLTKKEMGKINIV